MYGEFYLANPKLFEDKYDCNIPLDFESLTDRQIQKRYFELSKIQNPNYTRQQHRQFAITWNKKGLLRDIEKCREIEDYYFDKFDKQVGVLSLTANPSNLKLWKLYTNNHQGFYIGFESEIISNYLEVFGSCGPVHYEEKFPSISPFVNEHEETPSWIQQVYIKLRKWKFEDEYRVFKMRDFELTKADRTIRIPKESIMKIIFGAKMSKSDQEEIFGIVGNDYPNLELFQAVIDGSSVKLEPLK